MLALLISSVVLLPQPTFASWNLSLKTMVFLEPSPVSDDAVFIGKALSFYHCFLMCSKFTGKDCDESSYLEDQRHCFAPAEVTFGILVSHGLTEMVDGANEATNRKAELIQFNNYGYSREDSDAVVVGHYPDPNTADATGGFVGDNLSLICGGMDNLKPNRCYGYCYALGRSRIMARMEWPRCMAASLPIHRIGGSATLWISGGITTNILSTTEFVVAPDDKTEDGFVASGYGPSIHNGLLGHCVIPADPAGIGTPMTALLVGGMTSHTTYNKSTYYKPIYRRPSNLTTRMSLPRTIIRTTTTTIVTPLTGTFTFDMANHVLSIHPEGPTVHRFGHTCGLVRLGPPHRDAGAGVFRQLTAAVVTGGRPANDIHGRTTRQLLTSLKTDRDYVTTRSTEFLVLTTGSDRGQLAWSTGPDFHHSATYRSAAVTAPDGTLVVTGGRNAEESVRSIFQMDCKRCPLVQCCQWTKVQQELTAPLSTHVALLVPDNFDIGKADNNGINQGASGAVNGTTALGDEQNVLVVAGGFVTAFDSNYGSEFLDFSPAGGGRHCDVADKFLPHARIDAFAGLVNGVPLFCGGFEQRQLANGTWTWTNFRDCQTLGSDSSVAKMRKPRGANAASIVIGRGAGAEMLWITGGTSCTTQEKPLDRCPSVRTTEFVSTGGGGIIGPKLPRKLERHCLTKVNQSLAVMTGGTKNRLSPNSIKTTYWVTMVEEGTTVVPRMSLGPNMLYMRESHGCGRITLAKRVAIVAAGGAKVTKKIPGLGTVTYPYKPFTEILILPEDSTLHWRRGPDMPKMNGRIVGTSLPNDGAFLVVSDRSAFRLDCSKSRIADCLWSKLDHDLSTQRYRHVAVMVPKTYIPANACD